jgi:mycoredoxin-dependent peroxiredoxin
MAVEVGDRAPDFELKDQHGAPVKLSDYRGKKVVLVFYPLAFSGVCQGELCEIRDDLPSFGEADAQILAVSVDSMFSHRSWAEQQGYEFPLLSDFWPHGQVAQEYGVFDDNRGVATRGTFILDAEGVVRWKVVNAIPDARDLNEYRKVLAEL